MQKKIARQFFLTGFSVLVYGLLPGYSAFALRDPTMPPPAWQDSPVAHVNAINLQGIFQEGKNIHAVLNGVLVNEGDKFQQWVVKSIFSDRVILEKKSGEVNLVYLSDPVKFPVASITQKGTVT